MNLQNPLEKMSKSSPIDDKGTIFILDDIEITKNKIMKSKTDSENKIYYDEIKKPGISNLISIYSSITNKTIKEIENMYKDKNYKEFKNDLAEILEEFILPIQEKYKKYRYSKELLEILKKGKLKAQEYASKKITEVKRNIGIKYDKEI